MMVASDVPYTVVGVVPGLRDGAGVRWRRGRRGSGWAPPSWSIRPSSPTGRSAYASCPRSATSRPEGDGSVEFNEAATEVIVPNGRAMRIGGGTRGVNQVTRQILGYREQQASSESSFILTATIQ